MSDRYTGLCSWALRTRSGFLLADPRGTELTSFVDVAHLWLWTAEEAPAKAAALAPTIGRDRLTPTRAR